MSKCVMHMFSSRFIIFGPTFRSLIHFKFILVYDVRDGFNFICLHVAVQFSQHHLLKRLFSSTVCSCLPCHRLVDHRCLGFFLGFLSHESIFLFFYQYHTVLISIALQYNSKSGSLIPSAPFFFFNIVLSILRFLCFIKIFKYFFLIL